MKLTRQSLYQLVNSGDHDAIESFLTEINSLLETAKFALTELSNMTTAQFENGIAKTICVELERVIAQAEAKP